MGRLQTKFLALYRADFNVSDQSLIAAHRQGRDLLGKVGLQSSTKDSDLKIDTKLAAPD